jgi:hypothetical protein
MLPEPICGPVAREQARAVCAFESGKERSPISLRRSKATLLDKMAFPAPPCFVK